MARKSRDEERADDGRWIEYRRRLLGLSQAELGERIGPPPGISQPTMSRVEAGERALERTEFSDVCAVFGVTRLQAEREIEARIWEQGETPAPPDEGKKRTWRNRQRE